MIVKKQVLYPLTLSLLLVGMLFGYQNCSQSRKLKMDIDKSSESVIQSNLRNQDFEILFGGLLDTERKERIAADLDLDEKISKLSSELQTFKTQTNASLSSLEEKAKSMDKSINDINGVLSTRVTVAEEAIKSLEQKFSIDLIDLKDSLRAKMDKDADSLKSEILKNSEAILKNQDQTDEQKKQIAELTDRLLKLINSHEEFKSLVAVTYATKIELKEVKILYDSISISVQNLDIKIDRTKEEVIAKLGESSIDLSLKISELERKLDQQGKSITSIRSDLNAAITEYKTEIKKQSEDFNKLLEEAQIKTASIIELRDRETRTEIFEKINQSAIVLTLYTKKAVSEIANAIASLDKKIKEERNLSVKEKEEQSQNLISLKEEMSVAIAAEQKARNEISEQLNSLAKRVARLEMDTKELRQMAEINAKTISDLGVDFEAQKQATSQRFTVAQKEMDAKLNDLKNNFSMKLAEVMTNSQKLVQDLGEKMQAQFANVIGDIAVLNNRATIVESALKKAIEEYQTDRSKLINLEANIHNEKANIQPHIINTINSLTAVQNRFVQALAPSEKNKDFYDTDMRKLMDSCGGNKTASFANVMGLDSFQVLSMEYIRLLALGVRSGDAQIDAIFHSYGALESESNLSRSLSLALIRHTAIAEEANCLSKVQEWATAIILKDSRFNKIADKLANDEEFERRINVLYASFDEVKKPTTNLQEIIEKTLSGLTKKAQAYEVISARLVIDLVNDAWTNMLLTERLRNFSEIEKLQTSQGNLKFEMKQEFSDLRNKLEAFKESTNTRLTNLEIQQGKITSSLKKALDVIMTLADRSGYQDLVLVTKSAGDDIEYTPQIITAWSPVIKNVQHFFTGPNSLVNSTDACTGASIMDSAGAQYNLGGWNQCWANFRSVPTTLWGNEASTIWFRVFGSANIIKLKINAEKQSIPSMFTNYNYDREFNFINSEPDKALTLNGQFAKGVFDIKTPDILDYYIKNIRIWDGITVSVSALRKEGNTVITGTSMDYNIKLYSPLILDFIKKGMPMTLSKDASGVEFDHYGNGKAIKTGWVSGAEAGFLVRGHVKDYLNRKISGLDLFGQGTKLANGEKAKDGFEALAQFDENHDGVIDSKDSIFNDLSVWFDYNLNGQLDEKEMIPLSETGLTSIGLNYHELPMSKSFNSGNDIRFKSSARSFDGKTMANVYDVFFNTEEVLFK